MQPLRKDTMTDNEPDTTGRRIIEARARAGLSQDALARIIGVRQSAISRWESDHREPQLRHLIPLADALGITVESLIPGEHPITSKLSERELDDLLALLRSTTKQLEQLLEWDTQ